ncbi:dynein regulatory complex protein 10 isoform X1 [Homalodisca vitripennis]|uniref:dynein regulatory complex protein 10 isoform X1 n=2 Tax=Homalodisca vitripennis TaxID=197043 RepID=UPI001EEA001B|nr:dynein regulatory complex protein 10 isoform X1 [Homalodisca vitripennis]
MASSNDENNSYDFEASIQISRILKILSDTIKNTEIIMCLPLILTNEGAILKRFFPEDQIIFIQETCKKISTTHTSSDVDDSALICEICLMVDLVLSVPELGDFCRTQLTDSISPGGVTLLRNLEELRVCVSERLRITPKMEAQQDAELRQLYQQNIRNREEVERLTEKLNKLVTETEQEIEGKKQLIKSQIEKITKIRKQCRDSVKKKMDDAERQISWDVKNSEYRLEELQAGAKNAQYRREVQLKEHIHSERDLRAKRYKVESQLVAVLQKYDADIGERHAQLEEMTASYEEEKEQMALLQQQFDEQETEYVSLMLEKEHYERQQWEAKLYDIRCRIAARKIQRYFRAYLAATRAKGKKGKKGKKKK